MKRIVLTLGICAACLASSCSKPQEKIKPSQINISESSVMMLPGDTFGLTVEIEPEDSVYESIIWTSSNETIATVSPDDGTVTAIAPGTADIVADIDGLKDTCTVMVAAGNKLPEMARVGDFYLADGSLLGSETDESVVKAAEVIGIVFSTDTTRMGNAEKAALRAKGIKPHGLVLATSRPGAPDQVYAWYCTPDYIYSRDESELGMENLWNIDDEGVGHEAETFAIVNEDIEGYAYNIAIRTQRTDDYNQGHYPAFKAAEDFEQAVPSPQISTGWYLPSGGQWYDVLRNLAGVILNTNDSFLIDDYGNFSWAYRGRVPDLLNEKMSKVADSRKVVYAVVGNQDSYWTSSAVAHDQARVFIFDNATFVYSWWYYKYFQFSVRTVLGF